jgi:hypothetical protein
VTGQTGEGRPEHVAAVEPAEAVPAPVLNPASPDPWSERDRRQPDDGTLAPQQRYPGRIATP